MCYGVNKVWESVDNFWSLTFVWCPSFLLRGESNWPEKNVHPSVSITPPKGNLCLQYYKNCIICMNASVVDRAGKWSTLHGSGTCHSKFEPDVMNTFCCGPGLKININFTKNV